MGGCKSGGAGAIVISYVDEQGRCDDGEFVLMDLSIFVLSATTMVFITFALTALALGFGALFPNFESDNPAEIPTSFGGLLFMMTAVSYLAGVVLMEAWPVYSFLSATLRGDPVRNSVVLPLVMGVMGSATLTILCVVLPLRAGVRRVRALDF